MSAAALAVDIPRSDVDVLGGLRLAPDAVEILWFMGVRLTPDAVEIPDAEEILWFMGM